MYFLKRIFNPEIFQGKYRRNNYFEGWYFKIIDKNCENILAVIPGVSITRNDSHAFIQFIDAISGSTSYVRYPMDTFVYSRKDFNISIGPNKFNRYGFTVDFCSENLCIDGKINNSNIIPYPKKLSSPGIMGPFSFVPFMECYHGIINIHCELNGHLNINGKQVDFTGGYGYVEKDWGSSFPKSWIWLQSNNFENADASIMFSIARIPWMFRSFNGMISFVRVKDRLYRFATYTGAKLRKLGIQEDTLTITVENEKYILTITVLNSKGGKLKAPQKGNMRVEIEESITAVVQVCLREKTGEVVFSGKGKNTGLELAGDYRRFVT